MVGCLFGRCSGGDGGGGGGVCGVCVGVWGCVWERVISIRFMAVIPLTFVA